MSYAKKLGKKSLFRTKKGSVFQKKGFDKPEAWSVEVRFFFKQLDTFFFLLTTPFVAVLRRPSISTQPRFETQISLIVGGLDKRVASAGQCQLLWVLYYTGPRFALCNRKKRTVSYKPGVQDALVSIEEAIFR